MKRSVKSKGLLVGMLVLGIVCLASASALAASSHLENGLWFKLNAVVQGNFVEKATGDITAHNFTAPLYLGFAWDADNSWFNVRVVTETAPGVWTNTYTTTEGALAYTDNFIRDFYLKVYVGNATDWFETYHTPYIKYVLDNAGAVKKATYSGTGEVLGGSFDSDALVYFGSVKISGSMVSPSKLPFTP